MAVLAGQLGYPCTEGMIRGRLAEMQSSDQHAVYIAELPGGQIAGWVGVCIFRAVTSEKCAEISGLIVDEQVRSRTIGKRLLDAAEKWARLQGCDVISVHSNVTRKRAHQFYSNRGFRHSKTQKLFLKPLTETSRPPE